jgi:alkylhydroperoxidase/carboxymuconolactone decarboxylase family protein YurZ
MNEIAHSDPIADLACRRERGIETYARIFDVPEKDVPAAMASRVGPLFAEEAFLAAGGPAWSSPALTDRERNMVIITALAAQGVAGDRLESHIRLAQHNGLECEVLAAMMTLVTNYIGQAHGSLAMEAVQRVAGPGSPTSASDANALQQ